MFLIVLIIALFILAFLIIQQYLWIKRYVKSVVEDFVIRCQGPNGSISALDDFIRCESLLKHHKLKGVHTPSGYFNLSQLYELAVFSFHRFIKKRLNDSNGKLSENEASSMKYYENKLRLFISQHQSSNKVIQSV